MLPCYSKKGPCKSSHGKGQHLIESLEKEQNQPCCYLCKKQQKHPLLQKTETFRKYLFQRHIPNNILGIHKLGKPNTIPAEEKLIAVLAHPFGIDS